MNCGPQNFSVLCPWDFLGKNMGCCSVTKSFPTLWDSMDCSTPSFSFFHHLLEFAQIHVHWVGDAIQPFHQLLLHSNILPVKEECWSESRGLATWSSSRKLSSTWENLLSTLKAALSGPPLRCSHWTVSGTCSFPECRQSEKSSPLTAHLIQILSLLYRQWECLLILFLKHLNFKFIPM